MKSAEFGMVRHCDLQDAGAREAMSAEEVAEEALGKLSAAFYRQDVDALLDVFARDGVEATYAGSEAHETATGPDELRALLGNVLSRPCRYRFTFARVRARRAGDIVHVVAEGSGYESVADSDPPTRGDAAPSSAPTGEEEFAYRLSGVLIFESGRWRWVLITGSEPTPPAG